MSVASAVAFDPRALLEDHVIIDVVEERALIAVVADDELDDATVLISAYEPDTQHAWTTQAIDRILRDDGPEETPR